MDKKTLSKFGWIVVLVLVLSVMLALATPLGKYIGKGISNIAIAMGIVNENAVDEEKVNQMGNKWENYLSECKHTYTHIGETTNATCTTTGTSGDEICNLCGTVVKHGNITDALGHICDEYNVCQRCDGFIVHENARYVTNEKTYYGGEAVYTSPVSTDKYYYGDYIYSYNTGNWHDGSSVLGWVMFAGWQVSLNEEVTDRTQEEYGVILESINKVSNKCLYKTFMNCTNLKITPVLPDSIICMDSAFSSCTSLIEVANSKLPQNLVQAMSTFYGCVKLKSVLTIPEKVNRATGCFRNCTSLKAIDLSKAINLNFNDENRTGSMFEGCISLEALDISTTKTTALGELYVTNPDNTISGCTALKSFTLPNNIYRIGYNFFDEDNTALTDIYYNGTRVQWSQVTKETGAIPTTVTVVHCSDGDICAMACTGGGTATCYQLPICTVCGSEYGKYASHKLVADDGAKLESISDYTHQIKATCSVCGYQGYKTSSHTLTVNSGSVWEYVSETQCKAMGICDCGHEKYKFENHTGGTASCIKRAICSHCNNEYGEYGSCIISGETCTLCGKKATIIETAHPLSPNYTNYKVLGTWDYSDAKSVNITIIYQTQGIYNAWYSITSGTDYISGSSSSETRTYLNKNGKFIDTTGGASTDIRFGGSTQTTKVFKNVDMLTGSIIFYDGSTYGSYYGVKVIITANYD